MIKLIEMKPEPLTTFEMIRQRDEGGLSLQAIDNTEQIVCEGVVFTDGAVGLHWRSKFWSVVFYPDWSTFVNVHIGSHPTNGTIIRFYPKEAIRTGAMNFYEWTQEEEQKALKSLADAAVLAGDC